LLSLVAMSGCITPNGLGLCDGGAIEAQIFNFVQRLNRRTTVKLCTLAPLLAIPCVCPAYAGHTPKAFQIVQKYKFSFTNQVFGVLFFQIQLNPSLCEPPST